MEIKTKEIIKLNKGITLIALIVTIVVLLILAGVGISLLIGENGILEQAQNAKSKTENGLEREKLEQVVVYASKTARRNIIDGNALKESLKEEFGNEGTDYTITGNGPWTFNVKDTGNYYKISVDGEVEKLDIISFKIGNVTYKALNGMTWNDWRVSEFFTTENENGYTLGSAWSGNDRIRAYKPMRVSYVYINGNSVKANETIMPNTRYYIVDVEVLIPAL